MRCQGRLWTNVSNTHNIPFTFIQNATAEHIHIRPYRDGENEWPLSTSAGWFPHTMPWGPKRHTGSHNITVRGLINWVRSNTDQNLLVFPISQLVTYFVHSINLYHVSGNGIGFYPDKLRTAPKDLEICRALWSKV